MLKNRNKIRILHVVGAMNRGGIETWLMHVLRNIDGEAFQMDFLVHTIEPAAYDEEIRSLGGRIIPCIYTSQPLRYAYHLKQILHEYGSYDIIHSHVHHYSGYVLRIAKNSGIRSRIAHSHNNTSVAEVDSSIYRRLYLSMTKLWIDNYATRGLACSQDAAADLFGRNWKANSRWQLLNYGINLSPFREKVDSLSVRDELGIPMEAFVIGHIGRFVKQKNHQFLLEIFAEIIKHELKAYLLLLGEGTLESDIKQKALQMGIADRIIFAGSRSDVPRVMKSAMDVFVFPSIYEGLGMVLIEAQSAGLPCVFSDVVPQEADVVKPLVTRLSLSQPASKWAKEIWRSPEVKLKQDDALKIVETSSFNIAICLNKLQKIYQAELKREAVT